MTQPIVPDPWVSPLVTALRDCLCETLNTEPYTPVTCGCCVRHSSGLPSADACDQAWVRVVRIYASPGRNPRTCPGASIVQIQLGVDRCVTGIDDNGNFPSCDTKTNEALLFLQDAAAMRRAVTCCDELADFQPVILGWEPTGPKGNCAGGALTIEVSVNMLAPALI